MPCPLPMPIEAAACAVTARTMGYPTLPKSSSSFGHRPDTNRTGPGLGHRSLASRTGSLAILLAMRRASSSGIARIGMAADIGEALTVRVHDFEAAV